MPSHTLRRWQNDRLPRLNAYSAQVAATFALIPVPVLAEENLRGFVALLSAHFQGFCRDLYTEATQLIATAAPAGLRRAIQSQSAAQIKLDSGNPNLQNLRADFDRFGFDLKAVLDANAANVVRLDHLAQLNKWRNYVVHHGVTAPAGPPLALPLVQTWRNSCNDLASELDGIMYNELMLALGTPPW